MVDVKRLEKKGYNSLEFSELGEDGIFRLRNLNGFCFFFDRQLNRCKEYSSRPSGCRIYPVNISPEGEIIVDDLCPAGSSLSAMEIESKGKRLIKLLAVIDSEADDR